jgi:osmotically-inducible protein OsmY
MTLDRIARTVRAAMVITALQLTSFASADDRAPDNTAQNNPNKSKEGQRPTADQSANDKADVELAAKIRRSVVADKALSTAAHNVKIIVEAGFVTLKGPVKSNTEKLSVEKKASDIAGAENVRNEIEVAR